MSCRPLARLLTGWFRKQARPLPWRTTLDPYAIWVSEIMLQQTQVKTVIPYYERWMAAFPGVKALAEADPERVLRLWEGLGYYRRARNLQAGARKIVADGGGVFPRAFAEVLELPGVGRYTAGAICSIAYNEPVPILDGNVIRVVSRLFGLRGNVKARENRELLWGRAEALVQAAALLGNRGTRPTVRHGLKTAGPCSDLNQSLMELGALICTPRGPACGCCPVRRVCVARSKGWQEDLPNLGERPASVQRRMLALALECAGHYLVRRQSSASDGTALWEFPVVDLGEDPAETVARDECARLGFKAAEVRSLCVIRHTITRHRITLEVCHAKARTRRRFEGGEMRWVGPEELEKLPLMAAHRRIARRLEAMP